MGQTLLIHGCKRVLLVEDEPDLRAILAELFAEDGLEVLAAASGEEALAALRGGFVPDLVLVDLVMPGMGGDELVAALRASADWRRLPVAVMTAKRSGFELLRALGADDVIEKPFTLERLNEAMASLCRRSSTGS
jgi:CheY-like chemotaxis protein